MKNNNGYEKVVERLQLCREQSGITQEEMGNRMDVYQTHYQKYEKGYVVISKKSLYAFERAGYDILWLLTGKKKTYGLFDKLLEELKEKRQKRKMLEILILITEEGARISKIDYDTSLRRAYEYLKLENYDTFSLWKKIREVEHLTQVKMASILKIDRKRLKKLEYGEIEEDAAILVTLYNELKYSPVLFFDINRYCLDELNSLWNQFDKGLQEELFVYVEKWSEIIKYEKEDI